MSIEAAIAELTAEVKGLREITTKLHDLRADAIETVRGAAAPRAAKAKDKPTEEKVAAETKSAETTTETGGADENLNEVQAAIGAYVGQDGISAEERTARKEKALGILKKVGATKATDVPAEKGPAVIKAMKTLLEQGNLIKDEEPAGDEDLLG